MNCASCDICVYHLRLFFCFLSGVFLGSRVTGACPVTTDLFKRVNVRTTTISLYLIVLRVVTTSQIDTNGLQSPCPNVHIIQ